LLYNIIKFVDGASGVELGFYAKLVRAQLSSNELELLLYNCLSKWGAEFKPFVEKYEMLKNVSELPKDSEPLSHQYDKSAFGGKYPPTD
jgi:hypothetical protein